MEESNRACRLSSRMGFSARDVCIEDGSFEWVVFESEISWSEIEAVEGRKASSSSGSNEL